MWVCRRTNKGMSREVRGRKAEKCQQIKNMSISTHLHAYQQTTITSHTANKTTPSKSTYMYTYGQVISYK